MFWYFLYNYKIMNEDNNNNLQLTESSIMTSFSLEDVLGIYVFVQKQRELIIDRKEKSTIPTERLSLTFTANVLVDIMDEIHSLVELRENKIEIKKRDN